MREAPASYQDGQEDEVDEEDDEEDEEDEEDDEESENEMEKNTYDREYYLQFRNPRYPNRLSMRELADGVDWRY